MNAFQKIAVIMGLMALAYACSVAIAAVCGWAMEKLLGPLDAQEDKRE